MERNCTGKVIFATDPNETKCDIKDDFGGSTPCNAFDANGINFEYDISRFNDDYEGMNQHRYLVDLLFSNKWWIREEHLIFTEQPVFEEVK